MPAEMVLLTQEYGISHFPMPHSAGRTAVVVAVVVVVVRGGGDTILSCNIIAPIGPRYFRWAELSSRQLWHSALIYQ
jgi:hypothetical protein